MSSLGIALKQARKNINMTLRNVEDKTGISNAYLSQLENGKIKNPSIAVLSKLSSVYLVPLKELLVFAKIVEKDSVSSNEESFEFAHRIAFRAEGLTEEEKKEVLKFLEFIKTRRS